jgi:hypothetical protein
MKISVSPRFERVLKKRMKRGGYASPEDALLAGLASLEQQETFGEFGPGELDKLLAEGEADIARGDVYSVRNVFRRFKKR